MSLFGAPSAAPTTGGLFGAAPAASAAPTTSLFGAPAATNAASTAGLFGAPAATSAAKPLFGAATTSTAAPLFGAPAASTAATTAPLFGAAPTASAAPSFFGAAATTATAAPSLFGAPATTAAAGGGLFGAASAAKPLFGAPAATTTTAGTLFGAAPAAAAGGGLFGTATTAAAAAPSTGLGGLAGGASAMGQGAGLAGTTVVGKTDAQVENAMKARVDQPIMDLLAAIKKQLKENAEIADEMACASTDASVKLDESIQQLTRRLSSIATNTSATAANVERLGVKSIKDLRMGQMATAAQENAEKNFYSGGGNQTMQYIVELICEYNNQIIEYSRVLDELEAAMDETKSGNTALTAEELANHLKMFDTIFSTVALELSAVNQKVEDLKEHFMENYPAAFSARPPIYPSSSNGQLTPSGRAPSARFAGDPALPSQATAMHIASYMRSGAPAAAGTTSLFGAGTGTTGGLFGAASTAPKPFFSTGATTGSLFGATSTAGGATGSLFGSTPAATSTAAPSLFSSTPATQPTFGKTLSNNSSGLLFSSK